MKPYKFIKGRKKKEKHCLDCDADISLRGNNAVRCKPCARKWADAKQKRWRAKQKRLALKKR